MADFEVFNPTINGEGAENNDITAKVGWAAEKSSPRRGAPRSSAAAHANAAAAKALHACAAAAFAVHAGVTVASAVHADASVGSALHAPATSVVSGAHSHIPV